MIVAPREGGQRSVNRLGACIYEHPPAPPAGEEHFGRTWYRKDDQWQLELFCCTVVEIVLGVNPTPSSNRPGGPHASCPRLTVVKRAIYSVSIATWSMLTHTPTVQTSATLDDAQQTPRQIGLVPPTQGWWQGAGIIIILVNAVWPVKNRLVAPSWHCWG